MTRNTPAPTDPLAGLSAREREIMDIVYRMGRTTAADVRREMAAPPTDATVRSTLRVLEEKGWIEHDRDGARFVYLPIAPREQVKKRALGHLVRTFFGGSPTEVVSALAGADEREMSESERARIAELLRDLEGEG